MTASAAPDPGLGRIVNAPAVPPPPAFQAEADLLSAVLRLAAPTRT